LKAGLSPANVAFSSPLFWRQNNGKTLHHFFDFF
jgi:hypothetical protein